LSPLYGFSGANFPPSRVLKDRFCLDRLAFSSLVPSQTLFSPVYSLGTSSSSPRFPVVNHELTRSPPPCANAGKRVYFVNAWCLWCSPKFVPNGLEDCKTAFFQVVLAPPYPLDFFSFPLCPLSKRPLPVWAPHTQGLSFERIWPGFQCGGFLLPGSAPFRESAPH